MEQIKIIITDFDGTLVDTKYANSLAYVDACKQNNISLTIDQYNKFFDLGLCFSELCDMLNVPNDKRIQLKESKKNIYPQYFKYIKLNDALLLLLQEFKKEGLTICIGTTASKDNVYNILKYFNILDIFDYIVTGDDVMLGKPNPEVYYKILKQFNVTSNEALIFEDSISGIQAANNANVKYIKISL